MLSSNRSSAVSSAGIRVLSLDTDLSVSRQKRSLQVCCRQHAHIKLEVGDYRPSLQNKRQAASLGSEHLSLDMI